MNVFQSIFTAPNSQDKKQREKHHSTSPTLGKRSRTSNTAKHKQTPHSEDIPQPTHVSAPTSEPFRLSQSTTWPMNLRSELLHQEQTDSFAGKKRASSKVSPHLSTASGPPPSKKPDRRYKSRRDLHSSASAHTSTDGRLPSAPSFFSNQANQRPSLPYRLSSTEAGSKMLSKANKEENEGVRTLKLARGSMNAGSPSRPPATRTPSGSGRSYVGLPKKTKSPESIAISDGLNALNQIGVIELLEQDERPTFILDLSDQHNFEPGPLRILYANASLKAMPHILERITGIAGQESPSLTVTTVFSDFKAWTMSFVKDRQSLDVVLPSFFYAGATWTTCSLRKRFRLIKGSPGSERQSFHSNTPSVSVRSNSSFGKENDIFVEARADRVEAIEEEPQDYFGDANSRMSMDSHRTSDLPDTDIPRGPKMGMIRVRAHRLVPVTGKPYCVLRVPVMLTLSRSTHCSTLASLTGRDYQTLRRFLVIFNLQGALTGRPRH